MPQSQADVVGAPGGGVVRYELFPIAERRLSDRSRRRGRLPRCWPSAMDAAGLGYYGNTRSMPAASAVLRLSFDHDGRDGLPTFCVQHLAAYGGIVVVNGR
jgi:hypothetical protein